jgi:hypothetical protein|tara:strand:+ start:3082 stop:3267 length:186 start_codon:yes stop_codon:yes gene_type:complete
VDKLDMKKSFKKYLNSENVTIADVSINDLGMIDYYLDNNLFSEAEAIVNQIVIKERIDSIL